MDGQLSGHNKFSKKQMKLYEKLEKLPYGVKILIDEMQCKIWHYAQLLEQKAFSIFLLN
jgi:hypothetical protein